MKQTHLLIVTSIKEGWGLVVTEANSQGTPAVVYDRDGLRDSVRHMQTGLISERDIPQSLADAIVLALSDAKLYEMLRANAWEWSKEITFEKSYTDFIKILSDGLKS